MVRNKKMHKEEEVIEPNAFQPSLLHLGHCSVSWARLRTNKTGHNSLESSASHSFGVQLVLPSLLPLSLGPSVPLASSGVKIA